MIKANYILPVWVDILFDDVFRYEGLRDINTSLSEAVDMAKEIMEKYGFKTAVIIGVDTSEIFAELKNED